LKEKAGACFGFFMRWCPGSFRDIELGYHPAGSLPRLERSVSLEATL